MDSKHPLLSKAILGGILVILGVVGKVFTTQEFTSEDLAYLGVGLGILGIRFKLD